MVDALVERSIFLQEYARARPSSAGARALRCVPPRMAGGRGAAEDVEGELQSPDQDWVPEAWGEGPCMPEGAALLVCTKMSKFFRDVPIPLPMPGGRRYPASVDGLGASKWPKRGRGRRRSQGAARGAAKIPAYPGAGHVRRPSHPIILEVGDESDYDSTQPPTQSQGHGVGDSYPHYWDPVAPSPVAERGTSGEEGGSGGEATEKGLEGAAAAATNERGPPPVHCQGVVPLQGGAAQGFDWAGGDDVDSPKAEPAKSRQQAVGPLGRLLGQGPVGVSAGVAGVGSSQALSGTPRAMAAAAAATPSGPAPLHPGSPSLPTSVTGSGGRGGGPGPACVAMVAARQALKNKLVMDMELLAQRREALRRQRAALQQGGEAAAGRLPQGQPGTGLGALAGTGLGAGGGSTRGQGPGQEQGGAGVGLKAGGEQGPGMAASGGAASAGGKEAHSPGAARLAKADVSAAAAEAAMQAAGDAAALQPSVRPVNPQGRPEPRAGPRHRSGPNVIGSASGSQATEELGAGTAGGRAAAGAGAGGAAGPRTGAAGGAGGRMGAAVPFSPCPPRRRSVGPPDRVGGLGVGGGGASVYSQQVAQQRTLTVGPSPPLRNASWPHQAGRGGGGGGGGDGGGVGGGGGGQALQQRAGVGAGGGVVAGGSDAVINGSHAKAAGSTGSGTMRPLSVRSPAPGPGGQGSSSTALAGTAGAGAGPRGDSMRAAAATRQPPAQLKLEALPLRPWSSDSNSSGDQPDALEALLRGNRARGGGEGGAGLPGPSPLAARAPQPPQPQQQQRGQLQQQQLSPGAPRPSAGSAAGGATGTGPQPLSPAVLGPPGQGAWRTRS